LFQDRLHAAAASFGRATDAVQAGRMALALQGSEIMQQATLVAGTEYFRLIAVGALLAMVVSLFQRVFR
jgi:hypothetical protein